MGWGHLILGLHSWWLGQRGVDAQGLGGDKRAMEEERRGPGPAGLLPSPPPGKRRGPSNHMYLRDHAGDVAGIGGQQEGVGVFSELGEGAHVLLCHREGGGGIAMLGREGRGSAASRVPPKAHRRPCPQPALAGHSPQDSKTPHSLLLKTPKSDQVKARCLPRPRLYPQSQHQSGGCPQELRLTCCARAAARS